MVLLLLLLVLLLVLVHLLLIVAEVRLVGDGIVPVPAAAAVQPLRLGRRVGIQGLPASRHLIFRQKLLLLLRRLELLLLSRLRRVVLVGVPIGRVHLVDGRGVVVHNGLALLLLLLLLLLMLLLLLWAGRTETEKSM